MTDADFVSSDSKGNRYLVRDVLGAGRAMLVNQKALDLML
jgi:hypothetical protein